MSAFVVDPKTISRVLSWIMVQRDHGNQWFYDMATRRLQSIEWDLSDLQSLGQAMYNLNVNAVCQRYPDCGENPNSAPGTYTDGEHLDDFTFRPAYNTSRMQAYKSLSCWLYQCSEGNVPETALYKVFDEIGHEMAVQIVHDLKEWETARWE